MKIVLLGQKTIGDDVDLSRFYELGDFEVHGYAQDSDTEKYAKDADVLIVNKTPINEETIGTASHLRLVCVTATGTDNLDKDYLQRRGIAWRNVAGYSTESVAELTFGMFFYLWQHLPYYDHYVKGGSYVNDVMFTHFANTFREMSGKKWGIIGLGTIGHRVAEIAAAFGMEVGYYSTSGISREEKYPRLSFEELLGTSDVVSIHCPLSEQTEGLIDERALSLMKRDAILLNLSRGPVVNEAALCDALLKNKIAAAGLDVLTQEPMAEDNPLLGIQDSGKLIITPHIGWAAYETRVRLMDIIFDQVREFITGQESH